MKGVDTRPMFFDIRAHSHLKCIENIDGFIPTEHVVMLPSSPNILKSEQNYIEKCVADYINEHPLVPVGVGGR